MGKMSELDLQAKEIESLQKKEEQKMIINHNDKEIEFVMSDLSNEGQMSFLRANQLGQEIQNLEQQINERRFLASNYVNGVINELNKDEEEVKDADESK